MAQWKRFAPSEGDSQETPDLSIIVSTYQRPEHLRRVLASIATQRGHDARLEVVVADDGSTDHTPEVVRKFAESAPFPVHFTTAVHDGFRAAANRNRGVAASSAPYLLFLDGDCLIPPDHVAKHLAARRSHVAFTGYCIHLDQAATERIRLEDVAAGRFVQLASWTERFKLWKMAWKASFYALMKHPTRPKLLSGNVGIAREDFERVNGFDEAFAGWGGEDDDLGTRLRGAGVRIESILHATCTYHLWHPKSPSAPDTWRAGANIEYLHRRSKLIRCANGLRKRQRQDVRVYIREAVHLQEVSRSLAASLDCCTVVDSRESADVEIVFAPGDIDFSSQACVKVLAALETTPKAIAACRRADLVLCDHPLPRDLAARVFPLSGLESALDSLLIRSDVARSYPLTGALAAREPRKAHAA